MTERYDIAPAKRRPAGVRNYISPASPCPIEVQWEIGHGNAHK
jgi:hypothetical protein